MPRRRPLRSTGTLIDTGQRQAVTPKMTRRQWLLDAARLGGSMAAAIAGADLLLRTPPGRQVARYIGEARSGTWLPPPPPTATPVPPLPVRPYYHGCYVVKSVDELLAVGNLGVNVTISYGNSSIYSVDPSDNLMQAHLYNHMSTYLNLEFPYLRCSADGWGYVDAQASVKALVQQYHTSPVLLGYYIHDDDCSSYTDGEVVPLQWLHDAIRSIDADRSHKIIAAYSDAGAVARNYRHEACDGVFLYPYRGYDADPQVEIPQMLSIIQSRTPAGQQPHPWWGVYQAFATPNQGRPFIAQQQILDDVTFFIHSGAQGVLGFGWHAESPETYEGNNTPQIAQTIGAVSQRLAQLAHH